MRQLQIDKSYEIDEILLPDRGREEADGLHRALGDQLQAAARRVVGETVAPQFAEIQDIKRVIDRYRIALARQVESSLPVAGLASRQRRPSRPSSKWRTLGQLLVAASESVFIPFLLEEPISSYPVSAISTAWNRTMRIAGASSSPRLHSLLSPILKAASLQDTTTPELPFAFVFGYLLALVVRPNSF